MADVNVLLIPADENRPAVVQSLHPELDVLRGAIGGGWLEAVTRGDWHIYVDEEGLLKNLPVNVRASQLARTTLVGDAIVLGHTPDGNEASVPESVAQAVLEQEGGRL